MFLNNKLRFIPFCELTDLNLKQILIFIKNLPNF
jgi:hypothetical protein